LNGPSALLVAGPRVVPVALVAAAGPPAGHSPAADLPAAFLRASAVASYPNSVLILRSCVLFIVFPVFVASGCHAWPAALTTVIGAVDPSTLSCSRRLTFPPACSRPIKSSEKASPHASPRVLCDGPTKDPLGNAHALPLPPITQFPGHGVPAPRPSIQKRTARGGRNRDLPPVLTSAYPDPPSRRPTIPAYDRGCITPGRAARLFLGRCGSRLIHSPTQCSRSAPPATLEQGLAASTWSGQKRLGHVTKAPRYPVVSRDCPPEPPPWSPSACDNINHKRDRPGQISTRSGLPFRKVAPHQGYM